MTTDRILDLECIRKDLVMETFLADSDDERTLWEEIDRIDAQIKALREIERTCMKEPT